ncbi:hypothetical protein [Hwanghaeella sp.]|uniref:hypothetical protein n=1 Tax=Hwanghaeella sp. TaxID=2605943 RepID=UPI003CCC2AB5
MPISDRTGFIALLEQLRQDDDAAVVAAARDITQHMEAEGLTWEALIVDPAADHDDYDDEGGGAVFVPASDTASDAELIDSLLAAEGLSDDTRDELMDYKQDIAEGEFTEADSQYLRALAKRLAG